MKYLSLLKFGSSIFILIANMAIQSFSAEGPQGGIVAAARARCFDFLSLAQDAARNNNMSAVRANLSQIAALNSSFPGCAASMQSQIDTLNAQLNGGVIVLSVAAPAVNAAAEAHMQGLQLGGMSPAQAAPSPQPNQQVLSRSMAQASPHASVVAPAALLVPPSYPQPKNPSSFRDKVAMLIAARDAPLALERNRLQLPITSQQLMDLRTYLNFAMPSMVRDRGLPRNLLDTPQKIEEFSVAFSAVLPTLIQCSFADSVIPFTDALKFALRVNAEQLADAPINLGEKVRHVLRTYQILSARSGDHASEDNYNQALGFRALIYMDYVSDLRNSWLNLAAPISVNHLDAINGIPFRTILNELRSMLGKQPDVKLSPMLGEDFDAAITIVRTQKKLRDDAQNLERDFSSKYTQLYQDSLFEGYRYIWDAIKLRIDQIHNSHLMDPVSLVYPRLTYSNYFSACFAQNWAFVSNAAMDTMRDEMQSLYPLPVRAHYDPVLAATSYFDLRNVIRHRRNPHEIMPFGPNWVIAHLAPYSIPQLQEELTYKENENKRFEISSVINMLRDAQHGGRHTNDWAERIHLIYTTVPPQLIGMEGIADLLQAKQQVTEHIIGALHGCADGKNSKINRIEQHFRPYLGRFRIEMPILQTVAGILRSLIEDHINALEARSDSDEARTVTPLMARQKLRGPLGLLGQYEFIGHPGFAVQRTYNQPTAIIERMFNRHAPAAVAEYQGDVVNLGPTTPITVKRLVDAVYDEFDRSITLQQLNKFTEGFWTLISDENIHCAANLEDGVFMRYRRNHESLSAKTRYLRTMSFFVLEHMGYVRIQPEVKAVVYNWDPRTDRPGTYYDPMRRQHLSLNDLIERY